MEKVTVLTSDRLYNSFLDPKYIPAGQNKYYLRNTQVCAPKNGWRHLTSSEIETLVKNDNTAMSWDNILVLTLLDYAVAELGVVGTGHLLDVEEHASVTYDIVREVVYVVDCAVITDVT